MLQEHSVGVDALRDRLAADRTLLKGIATALAETSVAAWKKNHAAS
jgi:hypothetical protein